MVHCIDVYCLQANTQIPQTTPYCPLFTYTKWVVSNTLIYSVHYMFSATYALRIIIGLYWNDQKSECETKNIYKLLPTCWQFFLRFVSFRSCSVLTSTWVHTASLPSYYVSSIIAPPFSFQKATGTSGIAKYLVPNGATIIITLVRQPNVTWCVKTGVQDERTKISGSEYS